MGIKATIIGEEGADSPKFLEIAGKSAEGFVIVTNLNRDDKRAEVQNFLKTFESRLQNPAGHGGRLGVRRFHDYRGWYQESQERQRS